MDEVAALTDVLMKGTVFAEPSGGLTQKEGRRLVRDNAVRLLATLRLADPALAGLERPLRFPARVLELGLGPLYVITAFRWRYGDAVELYAVEHPSIPAAVFEERLAEEGVRFEPRDLLAGGIPWPGTSFDVIVLAEVIEHLPPTAVPDLLREIGTRLTREGRALISSPNPQALGNILSLAFGRAAMSDAPVPTASGCYGHIRTYSRVEMETMLEYAGLRVDRWVLTNWGHTLLPKGAALRDRARLLSQRYVPRLVPRWSSGWICSAARAR